MKKVGIDISGNKTKSVFFHLYKTGQLYNYVITVCDKEALEKCPIFHGVTKMIHWSFEDSSQFKGDKEEIMERVIEVRNEIENKVLEFLKSHFTDL